MTMEDLSHLMIVFFVPNSKAPYTNTQQTTYQFKWTITFEFTC